MGISCMWALSDRQVHLTVHTFNADWLPRKGRASPFVKFTRNRRSMKNDQKLKMRRDQYKQWALFIVLNIRFHFSSLLFPAARLADRLLVPLTLDTASIWQQMLSAGRRVAPYSLPTHCQRRTNTSTLSCIHTGSNSPIEADGWSLVASETAVHLLSGHMLDSSSLHFDR